MTSAHTAVIPLVCAYEVSCRVRAEEVARPSSSPTGNASASPQGAANGSRSISADHWVPRLHPRVGVVLAYWMELGAIGEKARRAVRLGKLRHDASRCWRRSHFVAKPAFRVSPTRKTPGRLVVCAG